MYLYNLLSVKIFFTHICYFIFSWKAFKVNMEGNKSLRKEFILYLYLQVVSHLINPRISELKSNNHSLTLILLQVFLLSLLETFSNSYSDGTKEPPFQRLSYHMVSWTLNLLPPQRILSLDFNYTKTGSLSDVTLHVRGPHSGLVSRGRETWDQRLECLVLLWVTRYSIICKKKKIQQNKNR